jgi:transposase
MDREQLERWLAEGLSVEEIARRVERHPSTVWYWLRQYGLRSAHADKHTPKGPLDRGRLTHLVAKGLTTTEIAAALGTHRATVRRWMRRFGLETAHMNRRRVFGDARGDRALLVEAVCSRHGQTTFQLRSDGASYRCLRCRCEDVTSNRRRRKERLVEEAGGKCQLCGYAAYAGALQFHHVDPSTKEFSVSQKGVTRSYERALAEARKCVLLCANCHAEVEAGHTTLVA